MSISSVLKLHYTPLQQHKQFVEIHTALLNIKAVLSSSLEAASNKQSSAMATGMNQDQILRSI